MNMSPDLLSFCRPKHVPRAFSGGGEKALGSAIFLNPPVTAWSLAKDIGYTLTLSR